MGRGQDQGLVEIEEFAVVRYRCSREQRPKHGQGFVHAASPSTRIDTADLELVGVLAADADAEYEPAGVPLGYG